jgi:hypothetical protein
MKEALSSSKTSVLTRATRRNIPEDTIIHSHLREKLKSYITILGDRCGATTPRTSNEELLFVWGLLIYALSTSGHTTENVMASRELSFMLNCVLWHVTPCGSCKNRRSEELVRSSIVLSSPILLTLMKEVLISSETSVDYKNPAA